MAGICKLSFFLLPFTFCLLSHAQRPTTQPVQQIRAWFDQLADPSPTVRDSAFDSLLGLSHADLPTLQRIVVTARPLKPNQRAALMQIVCHVFITGIAYEPSPRGEGFLGVAFDFRTFDLDTGERKGVIITACEQGFPAYRKLKPGDIVKGIESLPDVTLESTEQFKAAIQTFKGGETIVLLIERDGKPMKISTELRVRPANIEEQLPAWRAQIQDMAQTYWDEQFSRIVEEGAT